MGWGEGVGEEGVKTATIWGQGVAKRRVRNYLPQAQAILTPGMTGSLLENLFNVLKKVKNDCKNIWIYECIFCMKENNVHTQLNSSQVL